MLLENIIRQRKNILLYNTFIQRILVTISFYFLTLAKPKNNKILTDEGLHEFSICSKKIYIDYEDLKFFDWKNKQFKIGNHSPPKTILINGKLANFVQLLVLYSTLKEAKFLHRCFIIKVHECKFFTKYEKLFSDKNQLKLFNMLKEWFYIQKEPKKKSILRTNKQNYFAIINVNFTKKSSLKINILKNHQPNSDLLFLAQHFFDSRIEYNIKELFINNYDINIINLNVQKNIEGYSKFVAYLRCVNNLHSYSLGNYYYIPFKTSNTSLLQVFPFIVTNFLFYFLQYLLCDTNEDVEFLMVLIICLYFLCPVVGLAVIFIYPNQPMKKAFFCIFLSIVNFRIGLIYNMILSIQNLLFIKKSLLR
ncbi:hypothetical protein COBT_002275 [Conglomerata obtusa]